MQGIDRNLERTVRIAARALGRHGLAHAYGHYSARIDADSFLVCPARPMGLVKVAEPCVVVSVTEAWPGGVLGEVRNHQQIYRNRPEVGGIVRFVSPKGMTLGAFARAPKARYAFGAYVTPDTPLWLDPQLVRDERRAKGVAAIMGVRPEVLLRGGGSVTAGETLEKAVVLAWFLEDAC